ncbi:MAG TPA: PSD1 and planctomycete cytochrome C domain-containing protein [Planctomycetota bacterium]|nr:PSD1 and planctomycete cytochrome C domain-containing protein [Planctomycetota bacterium]
MLRRALFLSLTLTALIAPIATVFAADQAGIDFFESKIRPVLAEKCYGCHSVEAEGRKKLKGGLYLDSQESMLKGGKDGVVLVPGDIDKSKLISAIHYKDDDTAMPPKEKLPDAVIADFEAWVKMGAPDPRVGDKAPKPGQAIADATRKHWAFQPLAAPTVPVVKNQKWAHGEIDRFILAKMEASKLSPVAAADKRTLLRRATIDLTGLPPLAEDITAFEADQSPDAFAKAVDRLPASPAYGERWGRHWLDVARYADSKGYVFQEDRAYPYAYTYRDWVVKALNDDMPYDRFLQLQIAGDRLAGDDKQHLAAMGFLTVGRRFINNTQDIIDDRLDVIGRGTMGLTIACARCHDHKFDPIPTKDYYALYGVLDSSEEPKDLPVIGNASDPKATADYEAEKAKREKDVEDFRRQRFDEGVKALRSADQIAAYLRAAQEAQGKNGGEVNGIASEHKLEAPMLHRWRNWLEKQDAKHPVLAPWKALATVPDAEFAAKAKDVLANLDRNAVNALVADALGGKTPGNREELAKLYGALIAANDGDQPHGDANKEALRQVLRGEGTPTAVNYDKANDVLNGKDEEQLREKRKKVDELASQHAGAPARAMVMTDRKDPHNVKVFIRGQPGNQGEEAPRKFLSFIVGKDAKPFSDGSGRLELARAITEPTNPLTARVLVNRVWAWHFGTGLVRTPSDFGLRSEAPIHRELLDWLAVRFIADGWSLKKLHRVILLSAVYQQSADASVDAKRLDSENTLWSHANRQRLDFEAIRDSMLAVSGKLDAAVGGKSVDLAKQPFTGRRTIYGSIDRQNLPGMFRSFDFASPDTHTPQRFQTTVPQQALFLMNSPFAAEQARALAKRTEPVTSPEARVQALYRIAFARNPSRDETRIGVEFVRAMDGAPAEKDAAPIWSYGNVHFDAQARTISAFTAFKHFTGKAWQGGDKLPDSKLGWSTLNADGGHPGGTHDLAVSRRFTAPQDGTYRISGSLHHPSKDGDGVRGLAIVDSKQAVGDWTAKTTEVGTNVDAVELKAGQTIDFVLDCISNENSDSFSWAPIVTRNGSGEWNANGLFAGPPGSKPAALTAWERYAQALLMTNEFAFVN